MSPTPEPSSGASPGNLPSPSPIATYATDHAAKVDLGGALDRFYSETPDLHGVYEHYVVEEDLTLRYEIWIRFPAYRVTVTFEAVEIVNKTMVFATDGSGRIGVWESADDDRYVTRSLGEGAWILFPIWEFGAAPLLCAPDGTAPEEIFGTDDLLGRQAIHIRCGADDDGTERWIDRETGLTLLTIPTNPTPGGAGWSGWISLETDPVFDEGLFDPRSV